MAVPLPSSDVTIINKGHACSSGKGGGDQGKSASDHWREVRTNGDGVRARSGTVFGQCYPRQRQQEFITFLEQLDAEIDHHINTIHRVCDNVSTHHGKEGLHWSVNHPRCVFHFTPVHCSGRNQVEQWFSIFQRQRLRIADFASTEHLQAKIGQFISEWNQQAHPFNWSTKSVAKVMAEVPALAV